MATISTPLGFFVLALLIVETFLGTVVVGGNLEKADKIMGMLFGVGMFVLVTIGVFLLVWFKPQQLMFDKDAHLHISGRYGIESVDTRLLKEFWRPNGKTNTTNEKKLKTWMSANGLDPNKITMFIYETTFSETRKVAVADLGLDA